MEVSGGFALATGLALSEWNEQELWLAYFGLGGGRSRAVMKHYLASPGDWWPQAEHDKAAHALNEHLDDEGFGGAVAYSEELLALSHGSRNRLGF